MGDADYRVVKTYRNLPCAHRRWRHTGHCALIHGYSRSVTLTFGCQERDDNGFVIDFGGSLHPVKAWLKEQFDHTLLLDADDPLLPAFRELERQGACRLTVFAQVGMEGSAKHVYEWVSQWLADNFENKIRLISVECRENDKNAAIYEPKISRT